MGSGGKESHIRKHGSKLAARIPHFNNIYSSSVNPLSWSGSGGWDWLHFCRNWQLIQPSIGVWWDDSNFLQEWVGLVKSSVGLGKLSAEMGEID